jgi:membrane associated rhomboid family serine protease
MLRPDVKTRRATDYSKRILPARLAGIAVPRSGKGGHLIPIGDDPRRHRTPWFTLALIALNIAVFAYELSLPDRQLNRFVQSVGTIPVEILSGADLPPPAPGPVYLTLLTAMFVHGGFLHIASNMLYLWVFGDNVEDALGHNVFLIFYLATGIAAGLTHVFINAASDIPSVGASGAVAGVLGAYVLMFPQARIRTLIFFPPFITMSRIPALFIIGFWFVSQLVSGLAALDVEAQQTVGVAFWAHIGGFLAGLVLGAMLRPRRGLEQPAAW